MRDQVLATVRFAPVVLLLTSLWTGVMPEPAAASCNTPGEAKLYGAKGYVESPFFVYGENQKEKLKLDEGCSGDAKFENGDVLTLVFAPPSPNATRTAVVMHPDCNAFNGSSDGSGKRACEAALGGQVVCVQAGSDDVTVSGPMLQFRLPDTRNVTGVQLTGPLILVVTGAGQPLQCGVAAKPGQCADVKDDVRACVGRVYAGCPQPGGATPYPGQSGLVVLPPFNDYRKLCSKPPIGPPPSCDASESQLRFTLDHHGNMLIPMRWTGALAGTGGSGPCPITDTTCSKREVRARTAVEAFEDRHDKIDITAGAAPYVLESFNLSGNRFQVAPRFDLGPGSPEEMELVGDADKHFSVLRIGRCWPRDTTGDRLGCSSPQAAFFFDFATRMTSGNGWSNVGAVVLDRGGSVDRVCDGGANDGARCDDKPADYCGAGAVCVAFRLE